MALQPPEEELPPGDPPSHKQDRRSRRDNHRRGPGCNRIDKNIELTYGQYRKKRSEQSPGARWQDPVREMAAAQRYLGSDTDYCTRSRSEGAAWRHDQARRTDFSTRPDGDDRFRSQIQCRHQRPEDRRNRLRLHTQDGQGRRLQPEPLTGREGEERQEDTPDHQCGES